MPETTEVTCERRGGSFHTPTKCRFCGLDVMLHGIQKHWKRRCEKLPSVPDGLKLCSVCQEAKPLSTFGNRVNNHFGPSCGTCVDCRTKKLRTWRDKLGRAQKKLSNSPECVRSRKNRSLRFYHGITVEEFEAMQRSQGDKCAICGKAPDGLNRRTNSLHVDHDHITGKIRGLLCHFCNVGIGHFGDNPSLLISALDYLTRHKSLSTVA